MATKSRLYFSLLTAKTTHKHRFTCALPFCDTTSAHLRSTHFRFFSYHAPFSPHTVRVYYCCTCARPAHLNILALRYNDFLSKTPHNDFFKTTSISLLPSVKKCIPTHLRWQISDNYTPTFNTFPIFFHILHPFAPKTVSCVTEGIVLESISSILDI